MFNIEPSEPGTFGRRHRGGGGGRPLASVLRDWLWVTGVSFVPVPSRVLEDSQERR